MAPEANEGAMPPGSDPSRGRSFHLWLIGGLLAIGVLLTVTVVPGVFTTDDDNYLATIIGLRRGDFTLPETDGLPASRDLYWFDPWPGSRGLPTTPVTSVAPPLYAFFALPFSFLGWRGLIALNTLSFLISTWLVFRLTERHSQAQSTPWIAACAFIFGSFNIEYAQGVWPHMLSVALCLGAFTFAADVRSRSQALRAVGAGILAGLATGVRYQNIVFAGLLGLGLLLLAHRRVVMSWFYGLGVGLPLAVSSFINHQRFGSWNPVSKGTRYTNLSVVKSGGSNWLDAAQAIWAKVVDFRAHPPIGSGAPGTWNWIPDGNGAFVFMGTVKKALLQSSPWLVLAFGVVAAAWWQRSMPPPKRNEARAISLLFAGVFVMFALAGFRHDGLCFNQRYFLELVPLGAIALAWGLDGLRLTILPLLVGGLLAALAAALMLFAEPGSLLRTSMLMELPLVLAAALLVAWVVALRGKIGARLPATLVAASLVWACAAHVGDDLRASRRVRTQNAERLRALSSLVPTHAALFTFWGAKDALGPLFLERDFVLVDPNNTHGADMPMLVDAFLKRGTRVLIDFETFPGPLGVPPPERYAYRVISNGEYSILEVRLADAPIDHHE